jgi:DNA-nicking Smr family endonuclease
VTGKHGDEKSEAGSLLWRRLTKGVKPLKRDQPGAKPEALKAEAIAKSAAQASAPMAAPARPSQRQVASHGPAPGRGIDKQSLKKLKRGDWPIEAILDLHRRTQKEAHLALQRFIAQAAARGLRCVLVITGKGEPRGHEILPERRGVLREMLPLWLDQPDLAGYVLAVETARPKDGGAGAFYVLLRRHR